MKIYIKISWISNAEGTAGFQLTRKSPNILRLFVPCSISKVALVLGLCFSVWLDFPTSLHSPPLAQFLCPWGFLTFLLRSPEITELISLSYLCVSWYLWPFLFRPWAGPFSNQGEGGVGGERVRITNLL